MSFSCLHAGEFCHKTYAEASVSHCYAGMRSFSDFESKITVVFFSIFCTCQQLQDGETQRGCHIFSTIRFCNKIFVFLTFHFLFRPWKACLNMVPQLTPVCMERNGLEKLWRKVLALQECLQGQSNLSGHVTHTA